MFIWERQYFDKNNLTTVQGKSLSVLKPGNINTQAGPDFHQAHILLDQQLWVGEVEIHVKSSEWFLHNHHKDQAYDQVILHVVWSDNREIDTASGGKLPTLVLKNRISKELLLRHKHLNNSHLKIPCESLSYKIELSDLESMLNLTTAQRLLGRSSEVLGLLQKHENDWDQVTYLMYGKNFGFYLNSAAFSLLVRCVPLSIVRKLRFNLFQLEALFFGQAGFLQSVSGDSYFKKLQIEYHYLKEKYQLPDGIVKTSIWKYLRLRPPNFPTIRIAQFAAFMQTDGYRFSDIREFTETNPDKLTGIKPSPYWQYHYDFGKKGGKGGVFGESSSKYLVINTVVPMLVAYSIYTGQPEIHRRAILLLNNLSPEKNHIITYWKGMGFKVSSAQESQALLELYHKYCTMKRCLQCEIGKSLLTQNESL